MHMVSQLGRSIARSTDWKHPTLGWGPVDWWSTVGCGRSTGTVDRCARWRAHGQPTRPVVRAVDWLKAPHSRVGAGRPGGWPLAVPVDRRYNGYKYDRCASRPSGRPEGHFCPFQTANGQILERLYICLLLSCFQQVFRRENFPSLQVFYSKVFKKFLCQKDLSLFIFKGWKIQRKIEYLGY